MRPLAFSLLVAVTLIIPASTAVESDKSQAVVEANNRFALDLYHLYAQKFRNQNMFFSPFSISSSFAMLQEGARGKTAEEIQRAFHFPGEANLRREGYLSLYQRLSKRNKQYQLFIANALWGQKSFPFLKEYSEIVKQYYKGDARNLDFVNNAEEAREAINKWVEKETRKKIRDLLPKKSINRLVRLMLTSAIYFKGLWEHKFDRKLTKEEDFWVSSTDKVKVPMMRLSQAKKFNYAETKDLQILEMVYKGSEISMLVLLPKEKSLDKLEGSLTVENLKKWRKAMHKQEGEVYFPRFKIERSYSLKEDLAKMGMPSAFRQDTADLSGLTGTKELFLGDVFHKTYVEVNEEGTVAAAATGVIVMLGVPLPFVFRADHPFVFIIQDRKTGNILFRVN